VKKAGELVHIQFNESDGELQIINNLPEALADAAAHIFIYRLDGSLVAEYENKVTAAPSSVTNVGEMKSPESLSNTHFLRLELRDEHGKLVSSNFYWLAQPNSPNVLTDLEKMATVTLEATVASNDAEGRRLVTVTLHNPSTNIALMTHLQLRRAHSDERVLPVFPSDNYISLVGNETRTITLEAEASAFDGEDALVVVDGWNVTVAPASAAGVSIAPNVDAQPSHWPTTGLPFQTKDLR
jgi:hypothetical protein